jgi:hypothetical protein
VSEIPDEAWPTGQETPLSGLNLAGAVRRRFAPLAGVGLDLPARAEEGRSCGSDFPLAEYAR